MAERSILHLTKEDHAAPVMQLGPYGIRSLIPETEEISMTAYRVSIAAGETTSVSYHQVAEELYYVLSGSGTAILNGEHYLLQTGDFLRLPPGTTHGFITAHESLEMLDIHSPGSRPNRDVYFVGPTPQGFSSPSPTDP
jgi:quercetin dioxygenase-like cupin family protein